MATIQKNLSITSLKPSGKFSSYKIALVVAEWNTEITEALADGAISFLIESGVKKKNIRIEHVPGSFELALGAKYFASKKSTDAVICIGCIIKGETPHFDFISQACAHGIMNVSLDTGKPVAFGVLTTLDVKQAKERAGGKHGNKGVEAAETVLKMLLLKSKAKH